MTVALIHGVREVSTGQLGKGW